MNSSRVDRIARAVLYEGYILYPYRPSVKNRQRWTFGGLYPADSRQVRDSGDAWMMQTECLVTGRHAVIDVRVRFLHLMNRRIGEVAASAPTAVTRFVEALSVDDRQYLPWQEAVEREVSLGESPLEQLVRQPRRHEFTFPASQQQEPIRAADGKVVGAIVREQQAVAGSVRLAAEALGAGFKVSVQVANETPSTDAPTREDAVLQALASTHIVLGVRDGAFISLVDPPDTWRVFAGGCRNVGAWPVLVGDEGHTDTMLAAPIILYDYPQIAPESPGDLFDSTEIDEILTLRILTLTDEEKRAMAAADGRGGDLLKRTEALAREQLMALHGTIRGLHPVPEEKDHA